jgi:hypothetical protein
MTAGRRSPTPPARSTGFGHHLAPFAARAALGSDRRDADQLSRCVAIIPYQVAEPVGAGALLALALCDTAAVGRDD